jgi:hypothetical protein
MEQRHVQNISTLIHFMESLNDPRFSMQRFTHNCDTPSCALGWACTVPTLQRAGLSWELIKAWGSDGKSEMAVDVFGDYLSLFSMCLRIKTPQQWAAHAKAYLAKHGCTIVPESNEQGDDFKRFMELALKPVAVIA